MSRRKNLGMTEDTYYDRDGRPVNFDDMVELFDQDTAVRTHRRQDIPAPQPIVERGRGATFFAAFVGTISLLVFSLLVLGTLDNDAGAVLHKGECTDEYVIQKGDTLSKIGARFSLTVDQLGYWNEVANVDLIHAGDTICISQPRWAIEADMTGVGIYVPRTLDGINDVDPNALPITGGDGWEHVSIPATGNGSHQPSIEIRQAAWSAFGDLGQDVYVNSLKIARCESGFDAAAHRTSVNPASLSGDRGAWQINYIHDPWLQGLGIIDHKADLFDPNVNAAAARAIYDRAGGFGDWYLSAQCSGLR